MLNDKIEFYGEMLSMRAIALKIGVSRDTLQKHFDKFQDIYEAEKLPLHKSVVVTNNLVKNSGYSGNVLYSQSYTVKGNGNTSGIENTDYFYKPKISITSGFENYHNDLSISADYLAPDVPDENDDSSVVKNIENSQSAQEDAILANVNELLENIGKINAG